ncbi:TIM barrel protein [Kineococcus sp. SYSU DK003]|uniref:TIM barrel protein n=1 Tax=Kineococcus sp. SYSU DK003 TaxID=3383124 RepID=UPI003D7CDFF1
MVDVKSRSRARISAAPISWGILDVPGWGHQLDPTRVLSEMQHIGYTATEFGSPGFLPDEPAAKAETLAKYGMQAVGSFLDVVLHDADRDPLPRVRQILDGYAAAGAGTIVLAAATGAEGFDAPKPVLNDSQWKTLYTNLTRARELAEDLGVTAALHPHVGTMVETAAEVDRVVQETDTPFCLDTGHLIIGGTDPVEFARTYAARVSHVHLKDVDLAVARQVVDGDISFHQGCRDGLFVPLGTGDVDLRTIVDSLLKVGYDGWFVLEQDAVLAGEPAPGAGPVQDATASFTYLNTLVDELSFPTRVG